MLDVYIQLARDLYVVIKISILEEVSSLLEPVICYSTRCGYCGIGAPKISLVNEVQCETGTEWRGLIGQQHPPTSHSHYCLLFRTAEESPFY